MVPIGVADKLLPLVLGGDGGSVTVSTEIGVFDEAVAVAVAVAVETEVEVEGEGDEVWIGWAGRYAT